MKPGQRLAQLLREESAAYGYTLTIWGAGALLVDGLGMPTDVEVLAYVGGALLGFGVLALVTFESAFPSVEEERSVDAVSLVHVAATFGNLLVQTVLVAALDATDVPGSVAFLAVGFAATVGYNLLLLLELAIPVHLK